MTVYLDVFIIFGMLVNYAIFLCTKKLYNTKTNNLKMLFGSVICVAASLLPVSTIFILPFVLVAFVFKSENYIDYFRTVAVFLIVTFVFGGCAYGILAMIKEKSTFALIIIATAMSYLILTFFSEFYKKVSIRKNSISDVVIYCNGDNFFYKGLIDTGNSLIDPYTKKPVIIISSNENKFDKAKRLIPYNSIGSSNGFIPAFTPDKVVVGGKALECSIGIYEGFLSEDKSFNAIINPELIA